MSGFRQLSDKIRAAINFVAASRESEAVRIASDTLALVESRIIQTGKNSDGNKLPGYSKTQLPKSSFYGKSRNGGAEARVRKAKKTLSYSEFRELNNLQAGHVDLYFTGEMWRGTGVIVEKRLLRSTRVIIGGRTPESSNKIDWNSARYGGSILEPSAKELQQVRQAWRDARIKELRRIFG